MYFQFMIAVKQISKAVAQQIFEDQPQLKPFVLDIIDGTDTFERMSVERALGGNNTDQQVLPETPEVAAGQIKKVPSKNKNESG